MRIVHESVLHEMDGGNCFATLTYRDRRECTNDQLKNSYHVPDDWSLRKSHFQKFMKRLRKAHPQRIRYFHCGEYGNVCQHGLEVQHCDVCNVGRPHYHVILFNLFFDDLVPVAAKNGITYYTSPRLNSFWPYGFVQVGEVNFTSAAYVARYALKKITGLNADAHYQGVTIDGEWTRVQPEYCTMSRRPGIGREFYERYVDDIFPSDETPVPGHGVVQSVPRYYAEIFKETDPREYEVIKALRQEWLEENKEDMTPERLLDKYNVKLAQLALLSRGDEKK